MFQQVLYTLNVDFSVLGFADMPQCIEHWVATIKLL